MNGLPQRMGESQPRDVKKAVGMLNELEKWLSHHASFLMGEIEAHYEFYIKEMGFDLDQLESKYPQLTAEYGRNAFYISRSERYCQEKIQFGPDSIMFNDWDRDHDSINRYTLPLKVLDCATSELATCMLIEHDFQVFERLDPEFHENDFKPRFRQLLEKLSEEEKFRNSQKSHE